MGRMTGMGSIVEQLHLTTDGEVWAREFMNNVGTAGFVLDHDLMLGWFANAIETGKAHERRRLVADPNKHAFWQAVELAARERTPQQKALTAAVLLLSTRGDVYLRNEGELDLPCSSMTMENIFDALVRAHDRVLLSDSKASAKIGS